MKTQIKTTEAIFPMPVLLISTFNEDVRQPHMPSVTPCVPLEKEAAIRAALEYYGMI